MPRAASVDLSSLPAPAFVETIDFGTLKQEIIADFASRFPDANLLESDPAMTLLEVCAYREELLRQRVNDAGNALLIAKAQGSDLDQLSAFQGVMRLTGELDDRLRLRVLLSLTTAAAGTAEMYRYWAFTANLNVLDCSAVCERPGQVRVSILAADNQGLPSDALLQSIREQYNKARIPLTDVVNVRPARITYYDVTAKLTLYPGPDASTVKAAAIAGVQAYAAETAKLGYDVTLSELYKALSVTGVQNVTLTSPAVGIVNDDTSCALLRTLDVQVTGRAI